MSALDLAEAVEAATDALFRTAIAAGDGIPDRAIFERDAKAALTAAAPLIEAQVRERVAQEIEAQADCIKESALNIGRGSLNDYDTGALDAAHIAARIARGGVS